MPAVPIKMNSSLLLPLESAGSERELVPEFPSDAERDAFLAEIPTETTPAERVLLWNLFRHEWDGQGHVIEIGPFLGGTTRAIASGMLRNTRLSPAARLHTFDRFGDYYSPESLRQMIDPLVQRGTFAADEADRLSATGDFLGIFHAVHRAHPYAGLISAHDSPLPDFPGDVATATTFNRFENDHELGALFVDGCKSWASTVYAMQCLLPRLRTGAPVIFQDFGWYTCFWISSAVYVLRDVLEFQSRADATYVYRLKARLSEQEIARRFALTPAEMGPAFFQRAAEDLRLRSEAGNDLRGELIAQLHHIAALVTLGRKPQAVAVLQELDLHRYAAFFWMIRGCLKSPTYLPGNIPILWKEFPADS